MIDRTTRLRWRRRIRNQRRQVEGMSYHADEHLERHFFKRLSRLADVRRFVAAWILLIMLLVVGVVFQLRALGNYYLITQPVAGGSYTEGMLGNYTNANPLYATSSVDASVSRLIFASLLKYDQKNQLVGDLADKWETDERALRYTVHLRPNLTWQDGKPLTANDVVFTYKVIQNPDAKSPLNNSWQGITVTAPNAQTVVFSLPNQLSSFPYALTNGIVPEHKLSGVPMTQLRSLAFNTVNPVGSGPFRWKAIEIHGDKPENREQRIAFVPFDQYYAGKPKLNEFIIRAFHDNKQLLASFKNQELNGVVGLESLPEDLDKNLNVYAHSIPLTSEVMVFFKTSQDIVKDSLVRQALLAATNQPAVVNSLGYPAVSIHEPLLQTDIGYDKNLAQQSFNISRAQQLLDQAGWKVGSNGLRFKEGRQLTFTLFSQNTADYTSVAQTLKKQWRAVGVNVEVILQSDTDLQVTLVQHGYDALLYGISIGVDPDVFAYWHSSQADIRSANRLNFSEYKSSVADKALEAGRTRSDPLVRAIKYRPFLEAWRADVPAIALYQPRFLYVTNGKLYGFDEHTMNTGSERYSNVHNWMIRDQKTTE